VSHAFEDTGVRGYKGQAGNLKSSDEILTVALQIHSVKARHAAEVRLIRGQPAWIIDNPRGDLPEVSRRSTMARPNSPKAAPTSRTSAVFRRMR
jgi:hypothetical protein